MYIAVYIAMLFMPPELKSCNQEVVKLKMQ